MVLRASIILSIVLVLAAPVLADVPHMKVDEVRGGMKGVMRTVLKGTDIEEIPLEVVDVIRGVSPGRDIVIVKLLGEKAERYGVARGMSGSPVYVEGKLLGALSFAWRFVKEPLAGVTPIESMTSVWRANDKPVEVPAATWSAGESDGIRAAERFVERLLDPTPSYVLACPANLRPIETPLAVSGLPSSSLRGLAERLREFNVTVVKGGAVGRAVNAPADLKLEPGSALCVQIVRGDFEVAGIGTVTEISGNRFYGFGHPMFNAGAAQFPVATGVIHAVVPSAETSFKLGSPVKTVGTLWIDQPSAIAGEIGPIPEMMPMTLELRRRDVAGDARFRFEVVRDPRLMLTFLNEALRGGLETGGMPNPDVTIAVRADIEIEGYAPVSVDRVFGGPQATVDAVGVLVMPLGTLVHNPYARVNVKSIRLAAEVIPGDTRAVIRWAETDRAEYRPGDEVDVAVSLLPWRGASVVRHFRVKVPDDAPEGAMSLVVCDGASDQRLESREMPHRSRPDDVAGILDFFRRARPSTDVVIRLGRETSGLAVKGRELSALPDSVISILGKQPSTEVSTFSAPVVVRGKTEFVVVGQQMLQITVKK